MPPPDQIVESLGDVSSPPLTFSERKAPRVGEDEHVGPLEVVGSVFHPAVNGPVIAIVEIRSGQGVMGHKRIGVRKALFELGLKRVVVIVGVVAEIVEVLFPTVLGEERFPLALAHARHFYCAIGVLVGAVRVVVADHGRLINVVIGSQARENVRSLIAHV